MSKNTFINLRWLLILTAIAIILLISHHLMSNKNGAERYVNVYSSRKEILVRDVFDAFTEKYGIKVNYIIDDASKLIYRLNSEKHKPNADVLLVADVINLLHASEGGLLEDIDSSVLNANIPSHFRSNDWYGFTLRARVIAYAKDRVNTEYLKDYEDCADSRWKGKVLLRSSNVPYNQSLLASILMANGEERTREWVKGVVNNQAQVIKGGDTDQIREIKKGHGDITFINSYYLARLYASDHKEERELMEGIGIIFPNQDNRGTMVNISGGAVVKNAVNKDNAILLLEFMVSPEAQKIYSQHNQEYPIVEGVELSPTLQGFGAFKQDTRKLSDLKEYMEEAIVIADKEGWK